MGKVTGEDAATQVKRLIARAMPSAEVEAYSYNPVSIRVRVVDPSFAGQSLAQREERLAPVVASMPARIQQDLTMLLLLTPDEAADSLLNLEFRDPTRSTL